MGAKVSTGERTRSFSGSVLMHEPLAAASGNGVAATSDGYSQHHAGRSRYRTRSLSSAQRPGQTVQINTDATGATLVHPRGPSGSEERPRSRSLLGSGLSGHLLSYDGFKCPVCSKLLQHGDIECHLVMCLTKPKLNYNEDVLTEDKDDECVICLEEMCKGDTIARLPCLCIYHKGCIDDWFKMSRTCPEHPGD